MSRSVLQRDQVRVSGRAMDGRITDTHYVVCWLWTVLEVFLVAVSMRSITVVLSWTLPGGVEALLILLDTGSDGVTSGAMFTGEWSCGGVMVHSLDSSSLRQLPCEVSQHSSSSPL